MLHDLNRQLELSDRLETNYLRILYYEFPHKLRDSLQIVRIRAALHHPSW